MNEYDLIKTTSTYQKLVEHYERDAISHSTLLISADELSRKLFSIAFATLLICGDKDEIVQDNIRKGVHPDVFFLPKNDILRVEDVEFILEKLNYYPMEADCKIFILDNFSGATPQAQNKLLKTLEETPRNVFFLLCSEKTDGILQTIISRCRKLELEPLSESVLNILMSEYSVSAKTMDIAKFYGRGEMGRIETALENPKIEEMYDLSFDILKNCRASRDILSYTLKVGKYKTDLKKFIQIFSDVVQEVLHTQIMGENKYKNLAFDELCEGILPEALVILQTKLIKILEMTDRYCNTTMVIDDLLIQTCKCLNMK